MVFQTGSGTKLEMRGDIFMTLAKQIDKWYQAGEHEETVKAILNLSEADVTDSLTEDLAVAYNNLGQYQKAIDALKHMDCQNRSSPHWHYCMGYALYYAAMDSPTCEKRHALLEGAFDSFSHALKLNPEKELGSECRELLAWTKEDLSNMDLSDLSHDGERKGAFVCSVLLSSPWFDKEKFIQDFYGDWSLHIKPTGDEKDSDASMQPAASPCLTFSADNITAAITLIPRPVPEQEADKTAAYNYLWPNAVKVTSKHKAHLLITILDGKGSLMEQGLLLVKIASTSCLQLSATGVFTGATVYQLGLYRNLAAVIRDGRLPVFNWVWFGLYKTPRGISGYTYGLELFGKDEIEITDTDLEPDKLRRILVNLASSILEECIVFQDGDTVGLSAGQKLPVIRSEGIALAGMTLKIPYKRSDCREIFHEVSPTIP